MEEIEGMRQEVKQVLGIFGAWIFMAVVLLIILPPDLRWLSLIPVGFVLIAVISSCVIIISKRLGYFRPITARINNKTYTACMFCSYALLKENPVSKSQLIYKCAATDMKIIYLPRKIPGWCPYKTKAEII